MGHRILLLTALLASSVGAAATDDPRPKTVKQLSVVSATVMDDGTTNYLANGDFSRGFSNWQLHGTTKTVVTLAAGIFPPGVKGEALRYSKSDAAPEADYHINHLVRVPGPGTYVLSYWCKTTAPLVPLVVVRSNWNRADVEPAKLFEVENDGSWRHYENTFRIDPSWPPTFAIQVIPGAKGISPGLGPLGIGFSGETRFADFRCRKKPPSSAVAPD